MNHPLVNLLVRWTILALGVALAATLVPGISYTTGTTLAVVVLLLSLFNAILKPLLLLFTLPFIVLTLGVGVWLINALLLFLVGKLLEGFHVASFGSALLGAAIISITNVAVSGMLRRASTPPPGPGREKKRDDVIDI